MVLVSLAVYFNLEDSPSTSTRPLPSDVVAGFKANHGDGSFDKSSQPAPAPASGSQAPAPQQPTATSHQETMELITRIDVLSKQPLWAPRSPLEIANHLGGKIILDNIVCQSSINSDANHRTMSAYTYDEMGNARHGCWNIVVNMAHIRWDAGGESMFPMANFKPSDDR